MLPLATAHIAYLCKQFDQVCSTNNFYATFESIIFYQNSPKIKLFLKKNAKFSGAGGSAPRPPCLRRLGAPPPDPHTQPPKADFCLRTRQLYTVYNYKHFCSFCLEQLFSIVQMQTL